MNLLFESIIVGLITLIIGNIVLNLSINKINKDNKFNKLNIKPYGINFAFFISGVFLHILLNIIGFYKWNCEKECIAKIYRLSKLN